MKIVKSGKGVVEKNLPGSFPAKSFRRSGCSVMTPDANVTARQDFFDVFSLITKAIRNTIPANGVADHFMGKIMVVENIR